MLRRLRPLSERECYARLYGASDDAVRIVQAVVRPGRDRPPLPRRPPADGGHLSGEELRRLFEARLDSREANAA